MYRMNRASSYVLVAASLVLAAGPFTLAKSQPASPSTTSPPLNYEFFKDKVQPILLAKRDGRTRCVVCHTINNAPLHLVPLSPGQRPGTKSSRARTSSWSRKWWCPTTRTVRCSNIRSPKRRVAIPVTVEASTSPRKTTRSGRH